MLQCEATLAGAAQQARRTPRGCRRLSFLYLVSFTLLSLFRLFVMRKGMSSRPQAHGLPPVPEDAPLGDAEASQPLRTRFYSKKIR